MLKIRSGLGYDIHRTEPGNGLYIGGINVDDQRQFVAHSDGDVLIHALIDSLLGATGEKDIGELYPDTDDRNKNARGEKLLKEVLALVAAKGVEIVNIDCVIIAQIPKISPYKEQIRRNVSEIMNISQDRFNLKAKTKEKINDEVGRGEAIECFCTSLVRFT
jgi:2-C-methyl-D-erythritol 2,4-cyclodiphosphate synthase